MQTINQYLVTTYCCMLGLTFPGDATASVLNCACHLLLVMDKFNEYLASQRPPFNFPPNGVHNTIYRKIKSTGLLLGLNAQPWE